VRALYVALTRAKCHVTAWWGPHGPQAETPLQRVLFRKPGPCVPARVEVRSDLDPTARLAGTDILVEEFTTRGRPALPYDPGAGFRRAAAPDPRRWTPAGAGTSYSAITASAHGIFSAESPLLVDEPPTPADWLQTTPMAPPRCLSHRRDRGPSARRPVGRWRSWPGGVAFGSLVHIVFETFDPHSPTPADDLARIVAKEAARLPVPGVTESELVAGLLPVLATPLGPLADQLTLADIPARDRLAELDFELPLGTDSGGGTVQLIGGHARRVVAR